MSNPSSDQYYNPEEYYSVYERPDSWGYEDQRSQQPQYEEEKWESSEEAYLEESTEASDSNNLTVNLEDLVNEERVLYSLYKNIEKKEKTKASLCAKWWKVTKKSSIIEM